MNVSVVDSMHWRIDLLMIVECRLDGCNDWRVNELKKDMVMRGARS